MPSHSTSGTRGLVMISEKQIKELFNLYPVLSEVDQELLMHVLSNAKLVTLKAGTVIFEEFQPCNAFPFILSGNIRVYKQSVNGRELSLYNVTSGDACVVTAGCLLGDDPYNASGSVKMDSTLVMMTANDFENLLSSKVFRAFIFSLFSKRISELMQLVEEVAFQKLDRRLASLLLRRDRHIKVSHQELADELGTVREMITRVLRSFSDTGLIKSGRERIEILDESALKEIVEG
jgi:CRP/FNR family transcriptional regulator, anaerobic regulatory protein